MVSTKEQLSEKQRLISRCGLWCGTCRAYLIGTKDLYEKLNRKICCKGCWEQGKKCSFIRKGCDYLANTIDFCFECPDDWPCDDLAQIDKDYSDLYGVSPVANLKRMKEIGLDAWIIEQEEMYTCKSCEGEVCVHNAECFDCFEKTPFYEQLKENQKQIRKERRHLKRKLAKMEKEKEEKNKNIQ